MVVPVFCFIPVSSSRVSSASDLMRLLYIVLSIFSIFYRLIVGDPSFGWLDTEYNFSNKTVIPAFCFLLTS